MDASDRQGADVWDMSERQRARGTQTSQADTRDRKRGNGNDQRRKPPCERASASGKGGVGGRECEWTRVRDWW